MFFTKNNKLKKRFLIAAISLFIFFSNFSIYSFFINAWQPPAQKISYTKTYPVGIVLTGMSISDKNGNSFFGKHADRFLQTLKLQQTGVIQKVFISGGDGSLLQNKPSEANFLKKEFLAFKVSDSNIIVEGKSKNTFESAVEAKKILDSLHITDTCLLITSAIHMPRSIATFKKLGIKVVPHAANFEVVKSKMGFKEYLMPNIGVLSEWKNLLKEVVGMCTYKLTGKA